MARDVGGVRGARLAGGAERPLRDLAVGACARRPRPMLELVDVARRLVAEDLDRVLVAEVVGALDGVERVLLGIVLRRVAERRVDPALGRAGVATNRVDLRDDGHVGAHVERLDRGAHACAAAADDQHVVRRVHDFGRYTTGSALGSLRSMRTQASAARSSTSARTPAAGIGQPPPDRARSRGRAARRDPGPTDFAGPELLSTTCPRSAPRGGDTAPRGTRFASLQAHLCAAFGTPVPCRVDGNGAVLEGSLRVGGRLPRRDDSLRRLGED